MEAKMKTQGKDKLKSQLGFLFIALAIFVLTTLFNRVILDESPKQLRSVTTQKRTSVADLAPIIKLPIGTQKRLQLSKERPIYVHLPPGRVPDIQRIDGKNLLLYPGYGSNPVLWVPGGNPLAGKKSTELGIQIPADYQGGNHNIYITIK